MTSNLSRGHLQREATRTDRGNRLEAAGSGVLTVIRDVQGRHAGDARKQLLYHTGTRRPQLGGGEGGGGRAVSSNPGEKGWCSCSSADGAYLTAADVQVEIRDMRVVGQAQEQSPGGGGTTAGYRLK